MIIKSELIATITRQLGHMSDRAVDLSINHLLDTMCEALIQGERIEVRGFGCFTMRYRRPRRAHNPRTGIKLMTEAKHTPHFKPGKELREKVDAGLTQGIRIAD